MKDATLVFLIDESNQKICLAMKKRGFGANKLNGYGGKVNKDSGETIRGAAIRELAEETEGENGDPGVTINPEDLNEVAVIDFVFNGSNEDGQKVFVYLVRNWQGNINESEEMRPEWYPISAIPYQKMWEDDQYWLPRVLNGEKITAKFNFDTNQKLISFNISKLDNIGIQFN